MKKIIITNECRERMKSSEKNFLYDWEELVRMAEEDGNFKGLSEEQEICIVDYSPLIVGLKSIVKTDKDDEIVFAKRLENLGENIYSRFVKNKKKEETSKVLIFLNRDKEDFNKYNLFFMMPLIGSEKEPENEINSCKEMRDSLNYWSNHAFVFGDYPVDKESITKQCLYDYLYEKYNNI